MSGFLEKYCVNCALIATAVPGTDNMISPMAKKLKNFQR